MILDWLNEIEKIFPNLGGGSEEEVNQGWADAMARILENQLPEDKVSDKKKLQSPFLLTLCELYNN